MGGQQMDRFNPLRRFRIGDEVAVLQRQNHTTEVVDIEKVKFVGEVMVQTNDGRYYSSSDGRSIGRRSTVFIEPVTDVHRTALHRHRFDNQNRPLSGAEMNC